MAPIGPALPPQHSTCQKRGRQDDNSFDSSIEDDRSVKKGKVVGPSLPPTQLHSEQGSESDSDDDDFGPAPPPKGKSGLDNGQAISDHTDADEELSQQSPQRPQREAWMLAPPSSSDWSSKVDPTKLRNRKFNTSKHHKAIPGDSHPSESLWTETIEQKRKRIEDELLGASSISQPSPLAKETTLRDTRTTEVDSRIKAYNDEHRSTSLLEEHTKSHGRHEEDDPSKRAFDREKDIAGPSKLRSSERRELLGKAGDFSNRFARGKYL